MKRNILVADKIKMSCSKWEFMVLRVKRLLEVMDFRGCEKNFIHLENQLGVFPFSIHIIQSLLRIN